MSWTDERVETLKRMWAEGQSASAIAKELGGVTRNAVIGKVHRLGLSNRNDEPEPVPAPAPEPAIASGADKKTDRKPIPAAPAARLRRSGQGARRVRGRGSPTDCGRRPATPDGQSSIRPKC